MGKVSYKQWKLWRVTLTRRSLNDDMEMFIGQLLGKDLRQFFGGIKFLCESCEVRPSCVDSFSKSLFGLNDFQFVHGPKILIYAVINIKTTYHLKN